MKAYFEVHQSAGNEQWYWRLRAKNGRIIADGAEGYTRRSDCCRAVHRVIALLPKAGIR
jgi:uncharacterized protein YegP (UPF0339 family)